LIAEDECDSSLGSRGRSWLKRRATHTIDLLIGGVTGTLARPRTLLLGRRVGPACPTSGTHHRFPITRAWTSQNC
jgi:ATP-dependent DNA ligase